MKRSPISRVGVLGLSSFQRLAKPEPKPSKGPKQRKCKNKDCRKPFVPARPFITWCCDDCGAVVGQDLIAKRKAKEAKAERAEIKRKLEGYKSIPTLKNELQDIFNEYIRLRDADLPCICCGQWPKSSGSLTGGQWDAAHWRGRGSADHLRFNEDNVHKALKDCNKFGHHDYRGGLVAKIGIDRVVALECDQTIVKWTREWLQSKKAEYRAKIKALKEVA